MVVSQKIETKSIKAAIRTASVLEGSRPRGEMFVHKWSKTTIPYEGIHLQLPDYLFYLGSRFSRSNIAIAVGGTRSPSVESFCLASRVVGGFSKMGATIVSGGVAGIDLAAHLAALSADRLNTLAVLANPVDRRLAAHEWNADFISKAIERSGGFLSEYSTECDVGSDTYKERLLQRDRIISGISDVFIAFECSRDSATVDTARRALLQGKPVFAVKSKRKTWRDGLDQISEFPMVNCFVESKHSELHICNEIWQAAQISRTG